MLNCKENLKKNSSLFKSNNQIKTEIKPLLFSFEKDNEMIKNNREFDPLHDFIRLDQRKESSLMQIQREKSFNCECSSIRINVNFTALIFFHYFLMKKEVMNLNKRIEIE